MKLCAVIAEYNPFHNGHLKQIEYIKENLPDTAIVAIMSGNVVQRGELAVVDKYVRAEMAIRCGVDAVLELPYPWCGGSAGYFARGGVDIARAIGADYLCFGSESGDIEELKLCADRMNSEEYVNYLDSLIKEEQDLSYIALSHRAYKELYNEDIPDGANNTLAIEYLKNIGNITPVTYKRTFPSSATAARKFYRQGDMASLKKTVPEAVFEICKNNVPTDNQRLSSLVLWKLCDPDPTRLCGYADIDMGIASRLISSTRKSSNLEELLDRVATKKYTNSRLRRVLLNVLLGTTKDRLEATPVFTTLLGANETGRALIKNIKKKEGITVITKPADHMGVAEQFQFSLGADKLFSVARGACPSESIKKNPVIL